MITESIETLKRFSLFSDFSDDQFIYIKKNAKQMLIPAQKFLLKRGSEQKSIFLLLKGVLKLTAKDGGQIIITAGSQQAANAIARIRPCLYDVSSLTQIKIIVLSDEAFKIAVSMKKTETADADIEKASFANSQPKRKITQDQIITNITHLLYNDLLVLPSMPDIAIKTRKAIEDKNSNLNDVIKIINMNPSIAIKIINTANSVLYNSSGVKIDNSKMACTRLGNKMVMNLVLSYAMKGIFKTNSPLYKKKMNDMWHYSVKVAAVSSILARITPGFDLEKALLCGLLHNIGSVVILNYLTEEQITIEDPEILNNVLSSLQAEVGKTLLSKWGFPDDLVEAVEHSSNLFYNENSDRNYIDIVNIAQIHASIGTPQQKNMPVINQIPAFNKLALGQLTPELSIKILHKSQADIDRTIALFS